MGRKCVVPNCKSGYASNNEKVSMFSVPKHKIDEWQCAIARQDRKLTTKDYVCEKHFYEKDIIRFIKTECYSYELQIPKLDKDAIPCLFPNCPQNYGQLPAKKIKREEIDDTNSLYEDDNVSTNLAKQTHDLLFAELWNRSKLPTLPDQSWGIHFIEGQNNNDAISISKMILKNNKPTIEKSVLIDSNNINCYIFGNSFSETEKLNINAIKANIDLEYFLYTFNSLPVCHGALDLTKYQGPVSSKYKNLEADNNLNVWRHKKCTYYSEENKNQCIFCQQINRALYDIKREKETGVTEIPQL